MKIKQNISELHVLPSFGPGFQCPLWEVVVPGAFGLPHYCTPDRFDTHSTPPGLKFINQTHTNTHTLFLRILFQVTRGKRIWIDWLKEVYVCFRDHGRPCIPMYIHTCYIGSYLDCMLTFTYSYVLIQCIYLRVWKTRTWAHSQIHRHPVTSTHIFACVHVIHKPLHTQTHAHSPGTQYV